MCLRGRQLGFLLHSLLEAASALLPPFSLSSLIPISPLLRPRPLRCARRRNRKQGRFCACAKRRPYLLLPSLACEVNFRLRALPARLGRARPRLGAREAESSALGLGGQRAADAGASPRRGASSESPGPLRPRLRLVPNSPSPRLWAGSSSR